MNIEAKREYEPQDEPTDGPMNGPRGEPQDRHAIISVAFS